MARNLISNVFKDIKHVSGKAVDSVKAGMQNRVDNVKAKISDKVGALNSTFASVTPNTYGDSRMQKLMNRFILDSDQRSRIERTRDRRGRLERQEDLVATNIQQETVSTGFKRLEKQLKVTVEELKKIRKTVALSGGAAGGLLGDYLKLRGIDKLRKLFGRFGKGGATVTGEIGTAAEGVATTTAEGAATAAEGIASTTQTAARTAESASLLTKFGPMFKLLSRIATPLVAVTSAAKEYTSSENKEQSTNVKVARAVTTGAGSVGGMLAGAKLGGALGATVGSAVPVVGTVAGGIGGSILGGIGGLFAGEKMSKAFSHAIFKSPEAKTARKLDHLEIEKDRLLAKQQKDQVSDLNKTTKDAYSPAGFFSRLFSQLLSGIGNFIQHPIDSTREALGEVGGAVDDALGGVKATRSEKSIGYSRQSFNALLSANGGDKAIKQAAKGNTALEKHLRAVAFLESGGKAGVVNKYGYAGMFQFGASTGKSYGLNSLEDRKNPIKAAEAAAKYAKHIANNFHSGGVGSSGMNLYLGHQQGEAGGVRLALAAKQGKRISELPGYLQKHLYTNGGKPGMLVSDFIKRWRTDYANAYRIANNEDASGISIFGDKNKKQEADIVKTDAVKAEPLPVSVKTKTTKAEKQVLAGSKKAIKKPETKSKADVATTTVPPKIKSSKDEKQKIVETPIPVSNIAVQKHILDTDNEEPTESSKIQSFSDYEYEIDDSPKRPNRLSINNEPVARKIAEEDIPVQRTEIEKPVPYKEQAKTESQPIKVSLGNQNNNQPSLATDAIFYSESGGLNLILLGVV